MKNLWFLTFVLLSVGAMAWMFIMERRARAKDRLGGFTAQTPGAIQTRAMQPQPPTPPKPSAKPAAAAAQPARRPGESTGMFKR
jgi:hypothetical protein